MSGMSLLTPAVAPIEPEEPDGPTLAEQSLLKFGMALTSAADVATEIDILNVDELVSLCAQQVMDAALVVMRLVATARNTGATFIPWSDEWIDVYAAPVLIGMLRARGFVVGDMPGIPGRVLSWERYVSPDENYLARLHAAIGVDVHGYAIEDGPVEASTPAAAPVATATPRRRPTTAVRASGVVPDSTRAPTRTSDTRPTPPNAIYGRDG